MSTLEYLPIRMGCSGLVGQLMNSVELPWGVFSVAWVKPTALFSLLFHCVLMAFPPQTKEKCHKILELRLCDKTALFYKSGNQNPC